MKPIRRDNDLEQALSELTVRWLDLVRAPGVTGLAAWLPDFRVVLNFQGRPIELLIPTALAIFSNRANLRNEEAMEKALSALPTQRVTNLNACLRDIVRLASHWGRISRASTEERALLGEIAVVGSVALATCCASSLPTPNGTMELVLHKQVLGLAAGQKKLQQLTRLAPEMFSKPLASWTEELCDIRRARALKRGAERMAARAHTAIANLATLQPSHGRHF